MSNKFLPFPIEIEPLVGLFRTVVNNTIGVSVGKTGAAASWSWGDDITTIGDNAPTHTYTDGESSHDVDLIISGKSEILYFGLSGGEIVLANVDGYPNLEVLHIYENYLYSLDTTGNTALKDLLCYLNNLLELETSHLINLETLICGLNRLTSLDLSNNLALSYLDCRQCLFTSLDLSNNTALTYLDCFGNNITSLDVNNNTQLTTLRCYNNNISTLDVTNNTQLVFLSCDNNSISVLDLSNNAQLFDLVCYNNNISALNLSANVALKNLICSNNNISALDISNSTQITTLSCHQNTLGSAQIDAIINQLDTHGQVNGTLNYSDNAGDPTGAAYYSYQNLIAKGWTIIGTPPPFPYIQLFTTDSQSTISPEVQTSDSSLVNWSWGDGNTTLTNNNPSHTYVDGLPSHNVGVAADPLVVKLFNLSADEISSINVSTFINLEYLYADNNGITSVDLSNNTKLIGIRIFNNSITSLTLPATATITDIETSNNTGLGNVDYSSLTGLQDLRVRNTGATAIDVTSNTLLNDLRVHVNNITTLDLSNNPLITYLNISNTDLPSGQVDAIIIQLDSNGLSNGALNYSGVLGNPTNAAYNAYQNLIAKGWTIVGTPPPSPGVELFTTTSQGTVTPGIVTFSGDLITWDFGDGTVILDNNSPSHTYTDGQPSHAVKIYGVPAADIERIEVYGLLLNSLDVSPYTAVTVLQAFTNPSLSGITGLENLTDLAVLTIGNNPLIGNQDLSYHPSLIYLGVEDTGKTLLDISANPLLYRVWAWGNSLSELSVANNPLITELVLYDNLLTDLAIDSIINQLDAHGLNNGILDYSNNAGDPTIAAYTAYQNLIARGWTITGTPPPNPDSKYFATFTGTESVTGAITGWTGVVDKGTINLWVQLGVAPASETCIWSMENAESTSLTSFEAFAIIHQTDGNIRFQRTRGGDFSTATYTHTVADPNEWVNIGFKDMHKATLIATIDGVSYNGGTSSLGQSNFTSMGFGTPTPFWNSLDVFTGKIARFQAYRWDDNNENTTEYNSWLSATYNNGKAWCYKSKPDAPTWFVEVADFDLYNDGVDVGNELVDNTSNQSNLVQTGLTFTVSDLVVICGLDTNTATLVGSENDYAIKSVSNLGPSLWAVACWARFTSVPGSNEWFYIVSSDDTGSAASYIRIRNFGLNSTVTSYSGNVGDSSSTSWDSNNDLNHWAFNKNGTSLDVYLNGNLIGTNTIGSGSTWNNGIVVGQRGGYFDAPFSGNIFQWIQLPNKNFTAAQIQELANQDKGIPLCQGDFSNDLLSAFDYSGNYQYPALYPFGNYNGNFVGSELSPTLNQGSVPSFSNNGITFEDSGIVIDCSEPPI